MRKAPRITEDGVEKKKCSRCKEYVNILLFNAAKRTADGLDCYCQDCRRLKQKERYRTIGALESRHRHLKDTYGISAEEYESMFASQSGVCAICKKPETARQGSGTLKSLAVDHCHDTGEIRGLLCSSCNPGIGHFKHDTALLKLAIAYLKGNS